MAEDQRPFATGHILNEALRSLGCPTCGTASYQPNDRCVDHKPQASKACPKCGKDFRYWRVQNYDPIWRDGDVICVCGAFIRGYDAG